ncbi:DUF2062 domain-containing protein [Aquicoccus sp.]|uniref:DUF2062 domain-containing protein n=1 Tax=Aquicoccus sp. TaxID=2055851 RepID=UPI00356320FC
MVFRRRDKRPIWKIVAEFFFPRGGWWRAAQYVRHRLHRLPDPPHKIARGIWAGVFVAFTPFYGLHFVISIILARLMHGNIVAALLATFFGNPLTYIPIALVSLGTGHWLLGTEFDPERTERSLASKFTDAWADLWHNISAIFTGAPQNWSNLSAFHDEVFLPYLIGGIIPGIIAASVCYYLAVPVILAYQNRRRGLLKDKLESIKRKRAESKARDSTTGE